MDIKDLTMESVADMAGIKAKETDKISVEFTKDEVKTLYSGLEAYEDMSFRYGGKLEFTDLKDKLKNAHPNWKF